MTVCNLVLLGGIVAAAMIGYSLGRVRGCRHWSCREEDE